MVEKTAMAKGKRPVIGGHRGHKILLSDSLGVLVHTVLWADFIYIKDCRKFHPAVAGEPGRGSKILLGTLSF